MPGLPNFRPSLLKKAFAKIPSFSLNGRRSLGLLNTTQFLGVINDNVFKFVMAFLLIDALGSHKASSILSATGAVYVIPFLLFSSSAGILADRFSKQKLLVVMKLAEIIVMGLAIIAFTTKSVWGCYSLLFILATHSAMFGPSKYGIIPELVPSDSVSRANGLVTSSTYLAIIIGTFLASFLTEMTDRHFTMIAVFCLVIAIGGFCSALFIKQTVPQGSEKRINVFFAREIFNTLKYCRTVHHLLPAILGSSFFLFLGGFTQLNIIPFAIQSLHLSEIAGGYLFLITSLGIALGAFLAGRISRKRVELGISCLAGFFLALAFLLIGFFPNHLAGVICFLVLIGISGGAFIVPFDTFIQLHSHDERRGQTIAAANFLSFAGVLVASFVLYLFNQVLSFSPAHSFAWMGILTFGISIFFTLRLSDLSLPFVSKLIFHPLLRFKRPKTEGIEGPERVILVLENATWKQAILLAGTLSNVCFLIPSDHKKRHWFHRLFYSFHIMGREENTDALIQQAKIYAEKGISPCLFLEKTFPRGGRESPNAFLDFFKKSTFRLYSVKEEPEGKHHTTFTFERL